MSGLYINCAACWLSCETSPGEGRAIVVVGVVGVVGGVGEGGG